MFNIQSPAVEMFKKVCNDITPTIMNGLFTRSHSFSVCSKFNFVVPGVCTFHNGQNSIHCYSPFIWNMIPDCIKDSGTLDIFRNKMWKWKHIYCLCYLCKKYIPNLGFINHIWFKYICLWCSLIYNLIHITWGISLSWFNWKC